jgi:hypothetical protein
MVRKTITLPESTVRLVREAATEGESFSATVRRLIEEGARMVETGSVPSYAGMLAGPGDMGTRAEEYLRQVFAER